MTAVRRWLIDNGACHRPGQAQFEAGERRSRWRVVRDPATHRAVLDQFAGDATAAGFVPRRLIGSPILGGDGNREFLVLLEIGAVREPGWKADVERVLASSV